MEKIYIAFVSTPGLFASIIRKVLKQKYVHVALALDSQLEECYSIGRRNPQVPVFAGFERENKEKILKKYPEAEYRICEMSCTGEQKEQIKKILKEAYEHRFSYHYTILGLFHILFQIPFEQRNFYTCSSYIAELLETCEICQWEKNTSIVTPKDFLLRDWEKTIFEGKLTEIVYEKGENTNGNKTYSDREYPDRRYANKEGFFYG